MNFPANYIHTLLGVPILIIFTIASLRSYQKTKNKVSFYLGCATFFYMLTMAVIAIPALFTESSSTLTIVFLVASILEVVGGIFFWATAARIYAPRNSLVRLLIVGSSIAIALVAIFFAIRDFSAVSVTTIKQGAYTIVNSPASREYMVILSLQYASSIFIALALWRQGRDTKLLRDKVRLRVLSGVFALIFVVFALMPFGASSNGVITIAQSLQLMLGFALLGIFMAITLLIRNDKKA
jgi:hypothetical protein